MQNVSSSYLKEIKKSSRSFESRITIGNDIYTNSDLISMVIDEVQPREGFNIGTTISKSLELTVYTTNSIYINSNIKVEIGLNTDSGIEYVLIGYFNIDDIEKNGNNIKLTCYDNMMKFEKPYFSNLGKSASLKDIADELSKITGVEFTGSLPSYNLNKLEGFTCREILGFIASLCAGNAYITRDGKFTIKTLSNVNYSITDENYISLKTEEYLYKIGAITCKSNESELTKGALSNSSMEVVFENPWVNDSILTDIYNTLNGFEYIGYSMKWQGDLSLDVCDIISITDKNGVSRNVPILSQKFNYNGGLTCEIGAKGESKNKNEFNQSGNLSNKVNRIVADLLIVNETLINKADIGDLKALNGNIQNLISENVTITGKLNAIEGKFNTLNVDLSTIDKLIVTHSAQINDLQVNKANVTDLTATNATITNLEATLGKIQTLVNGNLTSLNIHSMNITSDKFTVENGFIKNAMIDSLDVSKINAGDILTNKFRIVSNDGGIEIVGNTQQFKDKNNNVRVQIGKDANGDFNFIIIGEDGTTTLIDHTGVKSNAIANDLIVGDMIASNSIGEKQIDYNSFITGFNKDTNTNTIKATKIMLDNQNQTLDIAFNSLKTQSNETKTLTESNSTTISVMQGQISTAINNTQIVKDGKTVLLKDAYNNTVQTIDAMSSTIGTHTTQIDGLNVLVNTQTSSIEQLKNQISLKVEETDIKEAINNLDISTVNFALKTSEEKTFTLDNTNNQNIACYQVLEETSNKEVMISFDYEFKDLVINPNGDIYFQAMSFKENGTDKWYVPKVECFKNILKEGNSSGSISFKTTFPQFKEGSTLTFRFRADYLQGTFTVKKVQVVTGNKKTDWSPSPFDFSNDVKDLITKTSKIELTADKINWLVASGTSSSNMQLTSDALKIISDNISLSGKVTFDSFTTSLQSKFDAIENIASESNKDNWNNAYNRVIEWAYGAINSSTTIDGGLIQANTITSKHILAKSLTGDKIWGGVIEGTELKTSEPHSNGGMWIRDNGMQLGQTAFMYDPSNRFAISSKDHIVISNGTGSNIYLMPSEYVSINGYCTAKSFKIGTGTDAFFTYGTWYSQFAGGNIDTYGIKLNFLNLIGTASGNLHVTNGNGSSGGIYGTFMNTYSPITSYELESNNFIALDKINMAIVEQNKIIPKINTFSDNVLDDYVKLNKNEMIEININNTITLLWKAIQELQREINILKGVENIE